MQRRLYQRVALLLLGLGLVSLNLVVPYSYPTHAAPPTTPQIAQVETLKAGPPRLSLPFWQQLPAGATNSLLDVPGVRVAGKSFVQGEPNAVRTGLTAIWMDAPTLTSRQGTLGSTNYAAGSYTAGGNGECTGTHYINQTGWLNGPILLTGTRSLGRVWEGVMQAMTEKAGASAYSSWLPVVCECWDARQGRDPTLTPIQPHHVVELLRSNEEPVLRQGRVGAGTGMRSFGLPAGLGSASRLVISQVHPDKPYTVGVLVNTNHSPASRLVPWAQQALGLTPPQPSSTGVSPVSSLAETRRRQGSIILLVATDAPLLPIQLKVLAQRAANSVSALGAIGATSSGEFAIAWSTAQPFVDDGRPRPALHSVDDKTLNQLYQAALEAGVEAQLNALQAPRD